LARRAIHDPGRVTRLPFTWRSWSGKEDETMSAASRRLAGILLVLYPTAVFGGVSLLNMLVNPGSGYAENAFRQDLWRAGHAHAAVLLLLSLVVLRYVDEANLSTGWKSLARHAVPLAAILLPVAFFLSVLPADATEPNRARKALRSPP